MRSLQKGEVIPTDTHQCSTIWVKPASVHRRCQRGLAIQRPYSRSSVNFHVRSSSPHKQVVNAAVVSYSSRKPPSAKDPWILASVSAAQHHMHVRI